MWKWLSGVVEAIFGGQSCPHRKNGRETWHRYVEKNGDGTRSLHRWCHLCGKKERVGLISD